MKTYIEIEVDDRHLKKNNSRIPGRLLNKKLKLVDGLGLQGMGF